MWYLPACERTHLDHSVFLGIPGHKDTGSHQNC